jgi:2-oxoglutarate dehydrogenase E1 component
MSGLVMLLPHGYEGQGPEHSSARVERFLQSCADDNLQVVNCTTPAQYFHVLRRQMVRGYRSPLVVFTPKSLLRLPRASSHPEELAHGRFAPVLDDADASAQPEAVERVVLCTGKVYYELLEERLRRFGDGRPPVALIRVEQLYPWPGERVEQLLGRFHRAKQVVWCQEEPENMGAWTFVSERLRRALHEGQQLRYAGRPESASPAVGSPRLHKEGQAAVLRDALGVDR